MLMAARSERLISIETKDIKFDRHYERGLWILRKIPKIDKTLRKIQEDLSERPICFLQSSRKKEIEIMIPKMKANA